MSAGFFQLTAEVADMDVDGVVLVIINVIPDRFIKFRFSVGFFRILQKQFKQADLLCGEADRFPVIFCPFFCGIQRKFSA